ncbi:MAG: hypothetical protein ACI9D0_000257 [Bacteroidia bacterium]|jgi:hypothetical protein
MKNLRFLPLLAIPAFLAFTQPETALTFSPAEDATVTITFENSAEFFLDDFSASVMGNDMTAMLGAVDVSVNMEMESEFTDTYKTVSEGRPVSFERTYGASNIGGEFTGSSDGESESQSFSIDSALEDSTVRFTWNDEDEDYTRAFVDDEEADADLLKGLLPRLDLGFMLPEGEVNVGDTWELDPLQLAAMLIPGGDLAYDVEGREDADFSDFEGVMGNDEAYAAVSKLMEGEVTATFKGMGEGDDSNLAEILVAMDISGEEDFADMVADAIRKGLEASGQDIPMDQIPDFNTFALAVGLDGEGTLVWDMRSGHVASFTMSAEIEVELAVNVSFDMEGMAGDAEGEVLLGGAVEIGMEASY